MLRRVMGGRYLFSSESVTEGHPDKLADQISDAVLDAIMSVDADGRVACETLVTTGLVMVAGEITTSEYVDIPHDVRKAGVVPYLRPDGKTQVSIEYQGGVPTRVDTVLVSAQHREEVDVETLLAPDMKAEVIDPVLREHEIDAEDVRVLVNPTGRFEIGGPKADTGLTGRKIIVDSYGGMAPHGGGAFSGKDPTKVDRSAAYMARYVAKNVVAAGLADRVQIQVAYAIGTAHPVSFAIDTFGTEQVDPVRIVDVVREAFDFRPGAIIRDLDLRRPIYRETAEYGHFGRKEFAWESTDRADELRRALE